MKALATIVAALILSGCGGVDRASPPKFSTESSRPMMDAAACIVRESDSRWVDRTGLGKTITHQIVTRAPGTVVEIQPMQTLVVGEEVYFARVSSLAGGRSKVEVFGAHRWGERMIGAVSSCL